MYRVITITTSIKQLTSNYDYKILAQNWYLSFFLFETHVEHSYNIVHFIIVLLGITMQWFLSQRNGDLEDIN